MSALEHLGASIQLATPRIRGADAERQMRTARAILQRLEGQPGLILADEVGMGKTYVALAVAAAVALDQPRKRPVVVMAPPSLEEKWPQEWNVFSELCLKTPRKLRAGKARTVVEFLKLLDDPPRRRAQIIFLSHGAFHRRLKDVFVKLALIQHALRSDPELHKQRRAFPRWADRILWANYLERRSPGIFEKLLKREPAEWRQLLAREGAEELKDDPVPEALLQALPRAELGHLRQALRALPLYKSKHLERYISEARTALTEAIHSLWGKWVASSHFSSPLLVLDEAHHVKNPATILASLFVNEEEGDRELLGALAGRFERMLFLTATPFQLGHRELLNVISRFQGIDWQGSYWPPLSPGVLTRAQQELDEALDRAQAAALRLDEAWGRLSERLDASLPEEDEALNRWWEQITHSGDVESPFRGVIQRYRQTHQAMRRAEEELRLWLIRHNKPRQLTDGQARRVILEGVGIQDPQRSQAGLEVSGPALLPFLLAARAQTVFRRHVGHHGTAFFAEGLASSYEAYLDTRSGEGVRLDDEAEGPRADVPGECRWYLTQLDRSLPREDAEELAKHPKVGATTQKALELWGKGEKVLVFCFYRATGRALRNHISRAIEEEVLRKGAQLLGEEDLEAVQTELDRIGQAFFSDDRVLRRVVTEHLEGIVSGTKGLTRPERTQIVEIGRRFVRTPSFLVRYFDLGAEDRTAAFERALNQEDASGTTIRARFQHFCQFMADRVAQERDEILDALDRIQTGSYFGREVEGTYDESELDGAGRVRLIPNVRLANGEVRRDARRRLMLAFNSPLFPEILVASSVLSEGVDLHLDCRHIIHHDLSWNPSTLEQRTGRVDRINCKAEVAVKPIHVYLPYVAGTQDERMFRVVTDRERWFKVVMGEKLELDEHHTEKIAERHPFPPQAAEGLAMRLEVAVR